MKLNFKIIAAIFIFAVVGITSCNKTEFGLTENENGFSESIDANGNILMRKDITKEELVKELTDAGKIISVTDNYAVPETNLNGILYKYTDGKGEEKEFVVLDKEPKQEDVKGILPHRYSVVHYAWTDVNGDIIYEEFQCNGGGSPNYYGWTNHFWVYN